MVIAWQQRTTYTNDIKSERSSRLLKALLEALLRGVRSGLLRRGRGRGNDCGRALLGRGLGHNFVARGLEDLDGVGEGLAGAKLTLGVPALHAERTRAVSVVYKVTGL